jgi:DNA-binding MarR family transcriptional regulator
MPFDTLIANAGRLRILTALAVENRQEFVRLRKMTQLTDGNLSAHARRLHTGGLIDIEKHFRDGKPVTTFHLTDVGRRRLTEHAEALLAAVGVSAAESELPVIAVASASADEDDDDDQWVD